MLNTFKLKVLIDSIWTISKSKSNLFDIHTDNRILWNDQEKADSRWVSFGPFGDRH